jgi:sugar lactone lactonase YvrE
MSVAVDQPDVSTRRLAAARLADRMGVTEGQLYTIAIGLVIGLTTAAIGIPPTLRDDRSPANAVRTTRTAPDRQTSGSAASPAAPSDAAGPAAGSYAAPSLSGSSTYAPSSFSSGSDVAGSSSGASGPGYADGGKLGDVERVTTVGSPGAPSGIAVDRDGGFYVVTDNGGSLGEPGPSRVLHYSASGSLRRTYSISGQAEDHSRGLSAVVLDGDGHLLVLDASAARVLRLDIDSGEQTELATLPDVPACTTDQAAQCEPSLVNAKPIAQAAALLPTGDLLVADAGQGILWKVDPGGNTAIWDKSSDYLAPDIGPSGLAVDTDGSVLLVVSKSVMGFGGAIYRIAPGDGKAGAHAKVYGTDANTTPNGIAVGSGGRIYVALTGSNTLLVLEKNGAVVQQITSPAFSKPFGLAWRGRSLLLTNQTPAAGDDPSSWSVLRAAADDSAATG